MMDLRQLYQEVILDHNRSPRNFRAIDRPDRHAQGHNPLCGDDVSVFLTLEDGVIRDIAFQGAGCAISTASASVMTEQLKGKTEAEARALYDAFRALVTGGEPAIAVGKLEVFAGVSRFPARVKCAVLVWHTLRAALEETQEPVTTE